MATNQEVLSQIAEKLAVCENEGLHQVKSRDPRTFVRGLTKESCMPKATTLFGEQIMLETYEYTLLVSPNGEYEGLVFLLPDGSSYKFNGGLSSIGHREVMEQMGFTNVSTLELKNRKKQSDRKKPLEIKGAIMFQPYEKTAPMEPFTYRKVSRPQHRQDGVVYFDGSTYWFVPGSELALVGVSRALADHGYDQVAPSSPKK